MIFCIVGFALGATIESKTKGIWIWVQEHPQFPDRYLVLLDTEGLGDAKKVSLLLLLLLPFHLFILFLLLLPAAQFPDRYLVLLDTEGLGDAKKVSLLLLLLLPLHLFILFLLLLPAAQFPDTEQAYIPIDKIIRTSKQSASTS